MTEQIEAYFHPQWPAPANVRAVVTTRRGGCSEGPFSSNNMALHVGDDPLRVAHNRARLCEQLGLTHQPQWLEQVHGINVVPALPDGQVRTADGCYTCDTGVACTVMTADCLPVLLCDRAGTQVAAVHAGWRGLAGGIVREALARFRAAPDTLLAYLGPAISQPYFEVGIDVLEGFYATAINPDHCEAVTRAFRPSLAAPMKYHADLFALARAELHALGVTQIFGGSDCSYADSDRFYSYRREAQTGRMVSAIWLV